MSRYDNTVGSYTASCVLEELGSQLKNFYHKDNKEKADIPPASYRQPLYNKMASGDGLKDISGYEEIIHDYFKDSKSKQWKPVYEKHEKIILKNLKDQFGSWTVEKQAAWAEIWEKLEDNGVFCFMSKGSSDSYKLILSAADTGITVPLSGDAAGVLACDNGTMTIEASSEDTSPDSYVRAVMYLMGRNPYGDQEVFCKADENTVVVRDAYYDTKPLILAFSNRNPEAKEARTQKQAAEELCQTASRARSNYDSAVEFDSLVKAAEENRTPLYQERPDCADEQKKIFRILSEKKEDSLEKAKEKLAEDEDKLFYAAQHFRSNEASGKTFDAAAVYFWNNTGSSSRMARRKYIKLLRECNVDPAEIRPSDFRRELVYMTSNVDTLAADHSNVFCRHIYEAVEETAESAGCALEDLKLCTDSGILEYTVSNGNGQLKGQIGQIFLPDKNMVLKTKFGAVPGDDINNNYLVPGYKAFVVPPEEGENGTLPERLRLYGYEHKLIAKLQYQLRKDLYFTDSDRMNPTVLNKLYKTGDANTDLPLARHDYNFNSFMTDELRDAILKTESKAVRFANMFKENAGLDDAWQLAADGIPNFAQQRLGNDSKGSPYDLSLLRGENCGYFDGYFDPTATGSGKNQGFIRYLAEGVEVDPRTMRLVRKNTDENARTPLLNLDFCSMISHSPFDRQQMVFSNLRDCIGVTERTGFAQMTFGGWNFDDGFVVSKAFAEKYKVYKTFRRRNGKVDKYHSREERTLMVGDKLCDFAGNKGVISLIVDPDMTKEAAFEKDPSGNLWQAVCWFRENPELEVVGAPYTAPSRFNGGTVLQMKDNSQPLKVPGEEGKYEEHALGYEQFIITHHTADLKTTPYPDTSDDNLYEGVKVKEERQDPVSEEETLYEETEQAPVSSEDVLDDDYNVNEPARNISAQLGWILGEKKCTHILHEFFGANRLSLERLKQLREYLIVLGYDLDEEGRLCTGYHPHPGENRLIREILPGEKTDVLYRELNMHGGFLLVPWPLKYMNGRKLEKGSGNADKLYKLPVISAFMRSSFYLDGSGAAVPGEFTEEYKEIIRQAVYDNAGAEKRAQRAFNAIASKVRRILITEKDNYIKDQIMTSKASLATTAVWTEDPTLNLDEVRVSSYIMENMHLCGWQEENASIASSHVLVWRDPVLRSGGIRYMKVVPGGSDMIGIAINPVSDKSFDGDFDGDTVAVVKLKTKEAAEEALEKFSLQANLLEEGAGRNQDGIYGLYLNHSLDLKQVEYENPSLREEYKAIQQDANQADADADEIVKRLNDYVHEAFLKDYGRSVIHFDPDLKQHLSDIWKMSNAEDGSGAKGKWNEVGAYLKFLGFQYEGKDIDQSTAKSFFENPRKFASDEEEKKALDESMYETQYATAVKSYGTGVAGAFSQRGIEGLRNQCSTAVTELTYPVTQAILQAKHSAKDARKYYALVMTNARRIWSGKNPDPASGKTAKEDRHLDKGQWIEEFKHLYKDQMGRHINDDYVETAASCLQDENGNIQSIESKEYIEAHADPMDALAYGRRTDMLEYFAEQNKEFYGAEGTESSMFAPDAVKNKTGFYCQDTQVRK